MSRVYAGGEYKSLCTLLVFFLFFVKILKVFYRHIVWSGFLNSDDVLFTGQWVLLLVNYSEHVFIVIGYVVNLIG